ncbi:phage protein NinX family protein [Burkholderia pyrrocinia]|uniref:phage protein NinX family protein n=1 Tax=Burkholderia pyrrocinia TaxID=60550 RepID=UPI001588FD67|nr:phage protein NinX family protein [Burkholderia pyrrocinia]
MKVSELTCDPLDYWVGRARLEEFKGRRLDEEVIAVIKAKAILDIPFFPSRNWIIGGRIIEEEGIAIAPLAQLETFLPGENCWRANYLHGEHMSCGRTPLEAAMRCFVKSRFGDEVPA